MFGRISLLAGALLFVVLVKACYDRSVDRRLERKNDEAHREAVAAAEKERREHPTPPELTAPPPAPERPAQPRREYASNLKGQLDRVDDEIQAAADGYEGDQVALRKATGRSSQKCEPGAVFNRFADVARMPSTDLVTYPMLKKNSERYAGNLWAQLDVKVVEIQEKDGVTLARIDTGGGKTMFVAGRFLTDLLEGQRADVVGYLAGDFEYTSRANWKLSIPAVAAIGMFKAGGFDRMADILERMNAGKKKAHR